jgi:FkbM family methyltransferase
MNFKRFIGKCRRGLDVVTLKAHASYSQVGEDSAVSYLFESLNLTNPTYLDIGTNNPIVGNNTYFFYDKGCRGVCIEPDPEMFKRIKKKRPGDKILNVGIGVANNVTGASFYLFPGNVAAWSTFSGEEARIREKESGLKPKMISIPLMNINDVIAAHFDPYPNFISLDVEGIDLDILKSMDFRRFQPEVICVETISFSITNSEKKLNDTINFMHAQGYFTYADTHVNTIFCKKELFKKSEK